MRELTKRTLLICLGVVLAFIPLEILTRTLPSRTQKVTITELIPNENANVLGVTATYNKAHEGGLYYGTKTGWRVWRNAKVTITNHFMHEQDVVITTNSLGHRYKELGEKQKNEYRILVLGDSITFEDYLNEEDTYPYHLERILNSQLVRENKNLNIKVVNAGVGAIGIENELAILQETGLSIKPDLIFLQLYLNDANESLTMNILRPPDLVAGSYFISYLYDLVNRNRLGIYSYKFTNPNFSDEAQEFINTNPLTDTDWKNSSGGFNKLIYQNFQDWGYAWSAKSTERIKEAILTMSELAKQNRSKFIVAIFPVSYQVHSNVLRDEPQKEYAKFLKQYHIPYIDLLAPLRKKYLIDREDVFYDQAHMKPPGNEFIAQEFSQFLLPQIN